MNELDFLWRIAEASGRQQSEIRLKKYEITIEKIGIEGVID